MTWPNDPRSFWQWQREQEALARFAGERQTPDDETDSDVRARQRCATLIVIF